MITMVSWFADLQNHEFSSCFLEMFEILDIHFIRVFIPLDSCCASTLTKNCQLVLLISYFSFPAETWKEMRMAAS